MHRPDDFDAAPMPLSTLDAAPGPIERAIASIRVWRRRRQADIELAQLDQRLLADIGLTRDGRRIDWVV